MVGGDALQEEPRRHPGQVPQGSAGLRVRNLGEQPVILCHFHGASKARQPEFEEPWLLFVRLQTLIILKPTFTSPVIRAGYEPRRVGKTSKSQVRISDSYYQLN